MNKDELIIKLEEGIKIEEELIPLYAKHVTSTLFVSEFSEEKRKEIKTALGILRNGSGVHRKIYLNLLEKIRSEDKDVY